MRLDRGSKEHKFIVISKFRNTLVYDATKVAVSMVTMHDKISGVTRFEVQLIANNISTFLQYNSHSI